jgi:diguanylate cyclase (GGDEF)-like protein
VNDSTTAGEGVPPPRRVTAARMANSPADNLLPLLAATIRQLLEADGLDDVRDAIAEGARLISPYDALTLREQRPLQPSTVTLRRGEELDANTWSLERHLCQEAARRGRTVSTLDRFAGEARVVADVYVRRYGLCLTRPLRAFGEELGTLTLHYNDRTALADAEFDALRRFIDHAAIALFNAHARQDLRDFAYTDSLTGLASRRQLDVELARLRDAELSLLLIDFDGLKAVNDALGYDRGDVLIATVAAALAANVKEGELAVRLGGDEFVVLLPGADGRRARMRAEELTGVLDTVAVPDDLVALFQGASVGSATAELGEDPRAALQRAGDEMRSRKRRRKTDRELVSGEDGEGRGDLHGTAIGG